MLYNFTPPTGAWPYGALVRDNGGNLYGTAYQGGYSGSVGVAFEVSSGGTETVGELNQEVSHYQPGTKITVRYRRYSIIYDMPVVVGRAR